MSERAAPQLTKPIRVLVVCGTRPEAIKMAPLVNALRTAPHISPWLLSTGQHREMLTDALALFDIEPDEDLAVMSAGRALAATSAAMLEGVGAVIERESPDLVLVHGDTNTTIAGALAAFYAGVPVGHVEAGLRTGDLSAPWPEEGNRKLVGAIATRHYAPTERAKQALMAETTSAENILVTGNTVIDALLATVDRLDSDVALLESTRAALPLVDDGRKLILVTGHRRENFGTGFESICSALARLAERDDVHIVYPVHLNPAVQEPVHRLLGHATNVHLIPPLGYVEFVELMRRSTVIITDSGGIQEEAPALGKPVLVMRDTTERPEAVDAGTVLLVGTDVDRIVSETERLLDDQEHLEKMQRAANPYGDGTAATRITADISDYFSVAAQVPASQ